MRDPASQLWRLAIAGSAVVAIAGLCVSTPAWAKPPPKPVVSSFAISPTVSGNDVSPSPLVLYNTGASVTVSAQVTDATTCTISSTVGRSFDGSLTISCSDGTVNVGLDLPANTGKRPVKYKLRLTATGYRTGTVKPITVTVSAVPAPATP
jgi:hypothetical protein